MSENELNKFLHNTLFKFEEVSEWTPRFRGSSLPICPRQIMLGKFFDGELTKTRTFEDLYNYHVGQALHVLVQRAWTRQGLLWGDWRCLDSKHCGMVFNNTALQQCPRCRSELVYIKKNLVDKDTGYTGHCDGVVFCEELGGYLVYHLKSRNNNVIKKKRGHNPYPNDLHRVSASATIISRKHWVPIAGRLILWLGKPSAKPYLFWYYPGRGEELYTKQAETVSKMEIVLSDKGPLAVAHLCESVEDARTCPFGPICFSPNCDKLILEKYHEFIV